MYWDSSRKDPRATKLPHANLRAIGREQRVILREQRVILREHYYNSLGSNTNLRISLARPNLTTSTFPWPAKARLLQHQTKTALPKIIRAVSAKLPHASRLRYLQQLAEEGDSKCRD